MAGDRQYLGIFVLNVRIPIALRDRLDELVVVLQRESPGVKLTRSDAVRIAIERAIAAAEIPQAKGRRIGPRGALLGGSRR